LADDAGAGGGEKKKMRSLGVFAELYIEEATHMKQLGTAVACCAIGALSLILMMCAVPERGEVPQWAPEAERSRLLDEQIERSRRFGEVLREIDQTVAWQGLPLRQAAARIVAAAERIDPEQLRLIDTIEREGHGALEKSARLLVKRFRMEIQTWGNPNKLPADLLERLEGQLLEMAKRDAARGGESRQLPAHLCSRRGTN